MFDGLKKLVQERKADAGNREYLPLILTPQHEGDVDKLSSILKGNDRIVVYDSFQSQLNELMKLRNPRKQSITQKELFALAEIHLNGRDPVSYGHWIYYPWSEKLVHLLPEDEFIEVRTNRNRYKITAEEAEQLANRKVGVIGLSVGQSVSVTMAMERSFGEIRLADFDELELSNFNRIRTGLYNLGVSKAITVAREIAELDPFLKVVVYDGGITEENMETFLVEGGKLDALIDECDGLDIKIMCRIRAKKFGIPVLMEASDRGTIDVERFDLEPERPILHGMVDHLDLSKIRDLKTNEEKVPYLLPIAGIKTLSGKMKASMLEIGQTLTTWPQLSSAVALGGGITADTYRRIMLGESLRSGRFFVDLDEIIPNEAAEKTEAPESIIHFTSITRNDVAEILKELNPNGTRGEIPGDALLEKFVSLAVTAPSAGNNQPWKWVVDAGSLFLFHDRARSVSFSDYADMGSMISFGTAIEIVAMAAYGEGFDIVVRYFPLNGEKRLVCRISFKSSDKTGVQKNLREYSLAEFIGKRQTNRQKRGHLSINEGELSELSSVAGLDDDLELTFCRESEKIRQLAEIISAAERIRIMHRSGHRDFFENEVRWTKEESESKGDGIDLATIELSESDMAGMKLASDKEVVSLLKSWGVGTAFEKLSREAVEHSAAIALLRIKNFDNEAFINGGRVLQRIWLMATKLGISVHPVSAALFMFARLNRGKGEELSNTEQREICILHEKFQKIFPYTEKTVDFFMLRLFKSNKPVIRSYRLPLDKVLIKL